MDQKHYERRVAARAARSPVFKNCIAAFFFGGGICALGQGLSFLYRALGVPHRTAAALVTASLIFLAALLTGLGVFDKLARIAGAGTLVPVTGFANSVVSPALDTKNEGLVLGVGAKIFTVAGPVLLFGTLAGCIYGVIYAVFYGFFL
ncbi:MAG: stage V sporulation protein AC [Clostridia bacterium]|nr:stage V sporulation protein AC [Clostridia bacterium]